jgi:hypothetical protein
MQDKEIQ